jgi:hypothetical protein
VQNLSVGDALSTIIKQPQAAFYGLRLLRILLAFHFQTKRCFQCSAVLRRWRMNYENLVTHYQVSVRFRSYNPLLYLTSPEEIFCRILEPLPIFGRTRSTGSMFVQRSLPLKDNTI